MEGGLIGLLKPLVDLWRHGSLLLWALAIAALSALLVIGALADFTPTFAAPLLPNMPSLAVAIVVLIVFAGFKTYQESNVRTLALVPNSGQSFWSPAPQKDGRELTQIALRGSVTNITEEAIYLTDVKLVSPRGRRALQKHADVGQPGSMFSPESFVPAKGRADYSAHFFVEGFIGQKGEERTIVIAVSDQFGHWHRVRYPNLRSV